MDRTRVEISEAAIRHNIRVFRGLIGSDVKLAPAIKANAYGHGLVECARIFTSCGADFLCVDALSEAEAIRKAGIKIPILIIGYVPLSDLAHAARQDCDMTVYNFETVHALGRFGLKARIHLKIETGNHRQGIELVDLPKMIKELGRYPAIQVAGVSTHFANLEDRVNSQYALYQLKEFKKAIRLLEAEGHAPHFRHCANTAAAILMPEAHFSFARVGIGCYGLWPSLKTEAAARRAGINIELKPALTWKTIVAQVKEVEKGSLIGYGCTYEMPRDGRIAVIPAGYYDGYVRKLSNKGVVLINGKRAPVIGRICMNMMMADITGIEDVRPEDEVVLIGRQGSEYISAEDVAEWSETINYEVTTRINEKIPRKQV
jgi:alanine racemase